MDSAFKFWTAEEIQLCIDTFAKMKRVSATAAHLSPILNRTIATITTKLSLIRRGILTIKDGKVIYPKLKRREEIVKEKENFNKPIFFPVGVELNFKPSRIEMSQGYMKVYF